MAVSFDPAIPEPQRAPCLCAHQSEIAWPVTVPAGALRIPMASPLAQHRPRPRPVPSPRRAAADRGDVGAAPLPFPAPLLDRAVTVPDAPRMGPHPLRYPGPLLAVPVPDAPAPDIVPDLDLQRFGAQDFIAERARLVRTLEAPDGSTAPLDLAALHLAHGLSAEALSHLVDVSPDAPEDRLRRDALRRLAQAFAGDTAEAGTDLPADWAFRSLVTLLDAPHAEHPAETVIAAAHALDDLPAPLRAQALPDLLAQAVSRELWPEAHALATRFAEHSEIADGSALHFLLGQVAEAGDEDVAAFDSYRRAALGRDDWAQRARLALVALGRRTGTLADDEAAELLTQAAALWRGGDIGRATREALAEARIEAGDRVGAVTALAEVVRNHPKSIAAQKARHRSAELLDEIYAAGTAGELTLGRFVETHRGLAIELRFDSAFHDQSERFADHLLSLGMTAAAAEEFGTLADLVAVAAEVDPAAADPARRARLRLRQAEALAAGGQFEAAGALLADVPEDLEPALRPKFATLRAEVSRSTGDTDGLLLTGPDPELMRLKADALFDAGQWRRASDFYDRYRTATGGIAASLAPRMALAAHRAGEPDRVEDILAALPKVEETPIWAEIAREIARPAEPAAALRRDTVERQIESAAEVADRSGRMRATSPGEADDPQGPKL